MKNALEKRLSELLDGPLVEEQPIQRLWSGYGELVRLRSETATLILKRVSPPSLRQHPRGWSSDLGHRRKLRSYEVERTFYAHYSKQSHARIPALRWHGDHGNERLLVLEDLDAAGFGERRGRVSQPELRACVEWLADFHASFLGSEPEELWEIGTYWHLETRPDEHAQMPEGPLKDAAAAIDQRLSAARFQTFVHGDAKLANFCFSETAEVAAVDFQYVGGGCGMKDLAYLFSCLPEKRLFADAGAMLDTYFVRLRSHLTPEIAAPLETEWRALYPFAWADFMRFLAGWAPGHAKESGYASEMTAAALRAL